MYTTVCGKWCPWRLVEQQFDSSCSPLTEAFLLLKHFNNLSSLDSSVCFYLTAASWVSLFIHQSSEGWVGGVLGGLVIINHVRINTPVHSLCKWGGSLSLRVALSVLMFARPGWLMTRWSAASHQSEYEELHILTTANKVNKAEPSCHFGSDSIVQYAGGGGRDGEVNFSSFQLEELHFQNEKVPTWVNTRVRLKENDSIKVKQQQSVPVQYSTITLYIVSLHAHTDSTLL